jgi:CheY-like chemotaxis protein
MENKIWILIADDEDDIRRIVRDALSSRIGRNVRIVEARDGSEAANKLQMQAFDCIITDLKMPRKDGGQFIKAVKESQFNAKTPIIVLTGFPDESITNDFLHITMLEKPIRAKTLVEEVQRQLKLGRTDQRVAAHFLNDFLSSVQEFLSQSLKQTPTIDTPKMKAPKSKLSGDVICSMVIQQGKTYGRFAIGFEEKLLREVGNRILAEKANDPSIDETKIAKLLGQMLFNNSLKQEGPNSPALAEIFAFNTVSHGNYKKLMATRGIIVEIHTEYGTAFAQALSGDDMILKAS